MPEYKLPWKIKNDEMLQPSALLGSPPIFWKNPQVKQVWVGMSYIRFSMN